MTSSATANCGPSPRSTTHGDLTVTDLTGTSTVTLPAEYALEHVRLGYAATEYGTQSATETASITLASPATTGRGLYVAMTRGRDENRRLRHHRHPRPRPKPATSSKRSSPPTAPTSPPSFNAGTSPNRTGNRHARSRAARSPTGSTTYAPTPPSNHRQAHQALDDSITTRAATRRDPTTPQRNASLWRTPGARPSMPSSTRPAKPSSRRRQHNVPRSNDSTRPGSAAAAKHAPNSPPPTRTSPTPASSSPPHASNPASPTRNEHIAREQIEAARAALSNHDMYAKWQHLPERLSAAKARVDALDTWHDWATGKPVDHQHLTEAVTALHEIAAHEPDVGARQLADVLHQWAEQRGIQLTPPPVQQHRSSANSNRDRPVTRRE